MPHPCTDWEIGWASFLTVAGGELVCLSGPIQLRALASTSLRTSMYAPPLVAPLVMPLTSSAGCALQARRGSVEALLHWRRTNAKLMVPSLLSDACSANLGTLARVQFVAQSLAPKPERQCTCETRRAASLLACAQCHDDHVQPAQWSPRGVLAIVVFLMTHQGCQLCAPTWRPQLYTAFHAH